MDNVIQRLIEKVDEYKEKIIYLSKKIYEYSELSFQEVKSS
jgi:metal-dependent amidase/aminoacylase/carboxypeptidase family protein